MYDRFALLQIGHSDKKAEQYACQNSRACCKTFPTQVRQGLIWVWADSSPQAHIESSMQAPTLSPEYGRHEGEGKSDFASENLLDGYGLTAAHNAQHESSMQAPSLSSKYGQHEDEGDFCRDCVLHFV